MNKEPHGKTGHLNVYTLDHDSIVTHYGSHDRVVAFIPQFEQEYYKICLYCRVDLGHNLGIPTIDQILDVARKDQGVQGRFKLLYKSGIYNGVQQQSIDYIFEKIK